MRLVTKECTERLQPSFTNSVWIRPSLVLPGAGYQSHDDRILNERSASKELSFNSWLDTSIAKRHTVWTALFTSRFSLLGSLLLSRMKLSDEALTNSAIEPLIRSLLTPVPLLDSGWLVRSTYSVIEVVKDILWIIFSKSPASIFGCATISMVLRWIFFEQDSVISATKPREKEMWREARVDHLIKTGEVSSSNTIVFVTLRSLKFSHQQCIRKNIIT